MKRILLLRDVTKEGKYTRQYRVRRLVWYIRETKEPNGSLSFPTIPYRALCISFGTRDLIICYRREKKKED